MSSLARIVLGLALLQLAPLAATATAQSASQSDEREYTTRLERGVEFYSQKSFTEAAAYLGTLTERYPDRKEAFLWLGHSRAQLRNWSAARDAYKRYSELAPKDAEGPRGVARTYESEDQPALAIVWYQRALDLEPGNSEMRQTVERLQKSATAATTTPAATPPPAPAPVVSEPPPADTGDSSTAKVGFWRTGLAGVTGARTVWWGRIIVLILFIGSMVNGATMTGKTMTEKFPQMPKPAIVIQGALAAAFAYVVWWGIPDGWTWGLLALCVLVSMSAISFGASQAQ